MQLFVELWKIFITVGNFLLEKKKHFFIEGSNNLPLARDEISDKVPVEIDVAEKLANSIYSALVDLNSHTEKTVRLLYRSLTDISSDLKNSVMEGF